MKRIMLMATLPSIESDRLPKLLITLGYAELAVRLITARGSLQARKHSSKREDTGVEGRGREPGSANANHKLILVDAIPIFITLQFLSILTNESHHIVC